MSGLRFFSLFLLLPLNSSSIKSIFASLVVKAARLSESVTFALRTILPPACEVSIILVLKFSYNIKIALVAIVAINYIPQIMRLLSYDWWRKLALGALLASATLVIYPAASLFSRFLLVALVLVSPSPFRPYPLLLLVFARFPDIASGTSVRFQGGLLIGGVVEFDCPPSRSLVTFLITSMRTVIVPH